jgi:hypothetical protein
MFVKAIMRWYSYIFHGLLALFCLAVSALALGTGAGLHLGMLPWSGDTLAYVLLFGALFGLLTIALAIKGVLRILFLIWSFLVFVLLLKGYLLSGYKFAPHEFTTAVYLMVGAFLALFGAWFQLQRAPSPAKKKF